MSKSVTVNLDEDAFEVFQKASKIVSTAGIRVPTGQLVETLINAEMSRLSPRKVAHRFLKSVMEAVGALARDVSADDLDEEPPELPKLPGK